jgi:DNA polymerase III subunit alpha
MYGAATCKASSKRGCHEGLAISFRLDRICRIAFNEVMAEFAHLHVHSEYSLLDGAIPCKTLAKEVKSRGMAAVALTDHANMFGAITHYQACQAADVTPILGCEVNVQQRPGGRLEHIVLLAENNTGYRNLLRIVSRGHLEPVDIAAPSVDMDTLREDTSGLIALTGCMGGMLPQRILQQGQDAGAEMLGTLLEVFSEQSLYVELQDHGLPEQPVLNGILRRLAEARGVPTVATNCCHFRERSDGEAQLYLSCIATGRSFATALEGHHGSYEMYLKTPAEMAQVFRNEPAALKATMEIAERCQALKLDLGKPMLPRFDVPSGFDSSSYLRHVAHEGLTVRLEQLRQQGKQPDPEVYRKRLDVELDIIISMDFPGYFLIVWDFIRYAKRHSVPVGPGRGSGAGSLVAYVLNITDLDPLEFNLLFERFLNPERVSMPDFDIDFCMERRDEVINYVSEKYGKNSVGQIATFHELKARSVIKDVARAMGIPPQESQRVANLIPAKAPGIMYTIGEALDLEPKLKAAMETDPTIRDLISQARRLEGLTRHAGMHAAGVVISDGPLWHHVPCFKNGETIVTQFAKDEVEAAGLVKFDFLGLKTLTVIDIAERLINERPDREGAADDGEHRFDMQAVPLDDRLTFSLLQSGETTGVFQLESSGMQQLFKDLRPTQFEDIVAAVALYRPGPLGTGMVKDFVDRKHGRQAIGSMHTLVDEVLAPTYGVIVYQEQVMQIAQKLAGYSLGGADLLRRAMGKKKVEAMAKQKGLFVEGALKNGVTQKDAEHIFGLLEYFAGYGFNKSHSAAYALLTYQTAYLKAHYPVEFLCALLTADRDKNDKVVRFIAEGRASGIDILPPEINESKIDFTVTYSDGSTPRPKTAKGSRRRRGKHDGYDPKVRFGLGAVRGVGEGALEALLEARDDGPIEDLFDMAQRVDIRRLNRGVLEALVQCGAFDASLLERELSRSRAFGSVERALERGKSASRDRACGQTNLFGIFEEHRDASNEAVGSPEYVVCEPWDLRETLRREKQALGFYVSGHPLDRYGMDLRRFEVAGVRDLSAMKPWSKVRIAGTVEGYRERIFRSGGKVAFFVLEDLSGGIEVKVRENQINRCGEVLSRGEPVLVSGKLQFPHNDEGPSDAPRDPTVLLDDAVPLSEAIRAETRSVAIRLRESLADASQMPALRGILQACPGSCPVHIVVETASGAEAVLALGGGYRVDPSETMLSRLERLFGSAVAELR